MNEQDVAVKVAAMEQSVSDHSRRIDGLERALGTLEQEQKALYELAASMKVITTRISNIEEKVNDTNKKINEHARLISDVENAPYKRTHNDIHTLRLAIITGICSLIASGAVTVIFNLIAAGK